MIFLQYDQRQFQFSINTEINYTTTASVKYKNTVSAEGTVETGRAVTRKGRECLPGATCLRKRQVPAPFS